MSANGAEDFLGAIARAAWTLSRYAFRITVSGAAGYAAAGLFSAGTGVTNPFILDALMVYIGASIVWFWTTGGEF